MEADSHECSLGNFSQLMVMTKLYKEISETGNVFEKHKALVVKRIEGPKEKEHWAWVTKHRKNMRDRREWK